MIKPKSSNNSNSLNNLNNLSSPNNLNNRTLENRNKFNLDYRIGFIGVLPDCSLGLPGFMSIVQEVSLFHTLSIPQAFDYYDKMGWVWVLTHWHVDIYDYPRVGDDINIATWPVRFKGYFGERGFDAIDANGRVLLAANSNWVLLDKTKKAPVRPDEYICNKYGATHPFLLERDFSLPKLGGLGGSDNLDGRDGLNGHCGLDGLDYFKPLSRHTYTTLRRDIDTNMHVNNSKYIEWVYCYLPDDIYYGYRARHLKVAYKKELMLGDVVEIRLFKRHIGEEVEIFALIEKDGVVVTEVYTIWQ